MSKGYGPLALTRPDRPVVGLEVSHESADLHVTGAALYTQDLTGRTLGTLHAWPVRAPHAHALVTDLRVAGAYEVPGVVRVLTAARRARRERRRREARRAAVPQRGHVLRARGLLGAGRDAGGGAAGGGPGRGRLRAAARADQRARRDRGRQLPGRPADGQPRRRGRPRWNGPPTGSAASSRSAGRSTSTWRPRPRWRWSTRTGRSSSSQARSTRARPRTSWPTCSAWPPTRSPCSACAWAAASAARSSSRTGWPRSRRSGPP